ncbi:MAG: vWA domain-containing protein [Bacillota bacterium]
MDYFKLRSVLNTDRYDLRKYGELREMSKALQQAEQAGSAELLTFPHLLGDTWAGLFKLTPQLGENIPPQVKAHQPLMEKLLENPEFKGMREFTKLDELASALGAIQMSSKLKYLIDNQQEVKDQINKAAQHQNQAETLRGQAETLKEAAKLLNDGDRKSQINKQASNQFRQATKQEKLANKLNEQASQMLAEHLSSPTGQEALTQAVSAASSAAREQTQQVDNLLSGLGYGTGDGNPQQVPVRDRLQLADYLRTMPKVQDIAHLTGRMKDIAIKKQKSKSRDSTEIGDIAFGNDPGKILASELVLLNRPEARQDFLLRFAEGKVMQLAPRGKERLGKGPIVSIIDTSGSMKNLDSEAKAVMLALLAIARKQKRAFAAINFSSANQCRVWEFPEPKKISPGEIVEMAQLFYNGGTDFQVPLNKAVDVIKKSKFKKADITMITDGDSRMDDNWLKWFLQIKKELQFQVIGIHLGYDSDAIIRKFADKVVKADSLFDEQVAQAVLAI